jgi:hypothetical protein
MKKHLSLLLLASILAGCAAGPCYQAMKFRKAAESAQGVEKAALLGKADAVEKECNAYNASLQEQQKHNAAQKAGR